MLLPATSPGIQMFHFSFSERIRQGASLLLGGRAASRVCSGTIGVRGCPPRSPPAVCHLRFTPEASDEGLGGPPWLCLTTRSHHKSVLGLLRRPGCHTHHTQPLGTQHAVQVSPAAKAGQCDGRANCSLSVSQLPHWGPSENHPAKTYLRIPK